MSNLENERWAEDARENFYEAMNRKDWNTCRLILADIEDRKIATHELRRDMNLAMYESLAEVWPEEQEKTIAHLEDEYGYKHLGE